MSQFYGDSVFWIEIDKVNPNPYQPRKEFDEAKLKDLADSIRQYGVLQPLVVTREEYEKPDGGMAVKYELIAGERRLRASKLAGLTQVPVLIRSTRDDARTKLELAIIENLQREDLNAIDRARAFERLVTEFRFKHNEIAEKIGKSREYVSNTLRLLSLSEEVQHSLIQGKISEGHTRPLLMLVDHPEEQATLYKEIIYKRLTVREAESIARRIAVERVRKKETKVDSETISMEQQLTESLGTRVKIERKDQGGKIVIDFFTNEDLMTILNLIGSGEKNNSNLMERFIEKTKGALGVEPENISASEIKEPIDDKPEAEKKEEEKKGDEDLYSVRNFSV